MIKIFFKKKLTISFLGSLFLFSLSCGNNYDAESEWLLTNEQILHDVLEKKLTEALNNSENDTSWLEKSIVVTKYDTTILGSFAKRVNALNECCVIEYTFFKNSNKKILINILNDTTNCRKKKQPKEDFLLIDSAKYFKITSSAISQPIE